MADLFPLAETIKGEIRYGVSLSDYTSFHVGGPADSLIFPADLEDLYKILQWCLREKVPCFVLGNGTNLLVRDGGIRGLVISLSRVLGGIEVVGKDADGLVRSGAGEALGKLVEFAWKQELAGLEFAAGIPGTVGGALFMNAGAFQGEMKDVVESVRFMDAAGKIFTRNREECKFSYRSMFLRNGEVILEGRLRLKKGNVQEIRNRGEEIIRKRLAKHPYDLPSAGSVFKNPPQGPAGKLIEEVGLKGMHIGDAQVSEKHANFIVNRGRARAQDILALIQRIREKVFHEKGIVLETEIRIVGED